MKEITNNFNQKCKNTKTVLFVFLKKSKDLMVTLKTKF